MNKLGEVLKLKGVKQKYLAEQLSLSPVMVSLYVTNKRQPKLQTLIKISQILKVEINDLIELPNQ